MSNIFSERRMWLPRLFGVVAGSLFVGLLLGELVSLAIDGLYRATDISLLQSAFYFLSSYRTPIVIILCAASLLFFADWIMAPVYNGLSALLSKYINVDNGAQPLDDLPKHMQGLQAGLLDINRELQLWKYATREAEQRKDELVVYLAHDLRTPLTSVLGYLELLNESPELPDATRQKYTGIALRKAGRMQALVEELFEVTRFNIGGMELERQPVAADIMINQLAEEINPLLDSRNISINIENDGVSQIFVDADKLARALDNVLHNAVYYTPEGGSVHIAMKNTVDGYSQIDISNTGSDIPQEKLNRFFEKFYRGDEARSSSGTATGGSGLGLAIAKSVIEAHGGSISAKNKDRVTTFTIII